MVTLPGRAWLAVLALGLAACANATTPAPTADPERTVLFRNGRVITLEPVQPTAEALLVRGGKIEAVGAEAELLARREPGTTVIDLQGRALMPGFVDAHTHVFNDARAQGLSLDQAQSLALQNGITTLGDLYADRNFLSQIRAFAQTGQLRVRTSLYLVHNGPCGERYGDWWKAHPPTRAPGEMLRIGGVKVFTDGGSCGGVALSFDREGVEGRGDLWLTQAELNQLVVEVQAAGHQAALHAIGDRAIAQALDAVEYALAGGPNTPRHRIEHVSVIPPEQVARFGRLGVVPVIPGQYPSCTPFGPPLPETYGPWEWPWRDLREQNPGLAIAWHSDYPYWSINPFIHLYGFVTRNDAQRQYVCRPAEWLKDDTLTVEAALSIMTSGSAYALFRETEVGSLRPGKYADVIVVSADPRATDPKALKDLRVLMTMVGGRVEYCASTAPELCPGYVARTPAALPDTRPPVPLRWAGLIAVVLLPLGFGAARLWPASSMASLARRGALAGIGGGAVWLLGWWLSAEAWSHPWAFVLFSAPPAMALGVVGLASAGRPDWLGWLGLVPAYFGALALGVALVLSDWFGLEEGWWMLLAGLMGHTLGLAWFGLANLRARTVPRLNAWPLLIGLLGGPVPLIGSSLAGEAADWPWAVLILALGLGWIALGALLLSAAPLAARPEALTRAD